MHGVHEHSYRDNSYLRLRDYDAEGVPWRVLYFSEKHALLQRTHAVAICGVRVFRGSTMRTISSGHYCRGHSTH